MFEYGKGINNNYAEAVKYYKLASDQGHAEAAYALGYMFEFGKGVAKNNAEAVRLYRLAADQGNADAASGLKRLTWRS